MGFTKLDSGIVDSSIWSEPYPTRIVWVTFMAKADARGMVRASHSGMARASNVSQEECESAIACLEAPDPDSRSQENDGRRIQKVSGGWLVLNYQKYRLFSYSNSPEAVRQRRFREKRDGRDTPLHVTKGRDISASASASASASEFNKLWSEWPVIGRQKKKYCEIKFNAIVKQGKFADFQRVTRGYFIFLDWQKNENNFEQRVMNLGTWLNNWEGEKERYVDENGNVRKPEPRL